MSIEAGVQFLFAKAPIHKGFPILFNDNRLYGDSDTNLNLKKKKKMEGSDIIK